MSTADVLKKLFPDLPAHRRTESDVGLEWFAPEVHRESGGIFTETARTPGLQLPRLTSSCLGAIERILFAFPAWAVQDADLVTAYKSIIGALPAGTKFVVVTSKSAANSVMRWFSKAGHAAENVEIVPLDDYVRFTDWAEDAYVSGYDASDGQRYLIEPWSFRRAGDALIAETVQEFTDIGAAQAPLIFQGGNCLVGDDFWLMGRDYMAETLDLIQERRAPITLPSGQDPVAFAKLIFRDFVEASRTLLLVGPQKRIPLAPTYGSREKGTFWLDFPTDGVGVYQPIFHIDMFLSLVGRDPDGKFAIMVASPELANDALKQDAPYPLQSVYDGIAKQLEQNNFRVIRNPLVHWPTNGATLSLGDLRSEARKSEGSILSQGVEDLVRLGAKDSDQVSTRRWHHITWNNCLVENDYDSVRRVYLPTFGHGKYKTLKPLDKKMKKMWEAEGFEVRMLGDFNPFAERQGVVHCISKYISRTGYGAPAA